MFLFDEPLYYFTTPLKKSYTRFLHAFFDSFTFQLCRHIAPRQVVTHRDIDSLSFTRDLTGSAALSATTGQAVGSEAASPAATTSFPPMTTVAGTTHVEITGAH